jgi:hypothetical protein
VISTIKDLDNSFVLIASMSNQIENSDFGKDYL